MDRKEFSGKKHRPSKEMEMEKDRDKTFWEGTKRIKYMHVYTMLCYGYAIQYADTHTQNISVKR